MDKGQLVLELEEIAESLQELGVSTTIINEEGHVKITFNTQDITLRNKDYEFKLVYIAPERFRSRSLEPRSPIRNLYFAGSEVGMVGVNVPIPVPMAFHSFGGWKRSLFGPLHMHGTDGVRFYTRLKTITARWPTGIRAGAEFSMPTMK